MSAAEKLDLQPLAETTAQTLPGLSIHEEASAASQSQTATIASEQVLFAGMFVGAIAFAVALVAWVVVPYFQLW